MTCSTIIYDDDISSISNRSIMISVFKLRRQISLFQGCNILLITKIIFIYTVNIQRAHKIIVKSSMYSGWKKRLQYHPETERRKKGSLNNIPSISLY
jgi:hypothetical protein